MFVRTDLPLRHQLVQSNHAVFHLAALTCPDPDLIPNIVLIGVPHVAALDRALARLQSAGIVHYKWVEPDFGLGFTAICTEPINGEKRGALANYRLWKHDWPVALRSAAPSKGDGAGSMPAGPAIAGRVEKSGAGFNAKPCSMGPGGRHSTALEWDGPTNLEAC